MLSTHRVVQANGTPLCLRQTCSYIWRLNSVTQNHRSSLIFSFCCFSCSRTSIRCMFSMLVNTFPHDFWFFVGNLEGAIGVFKNLDKGLLSRRGRREHLLEQSSVSSLIPTCKLVVATHISAGCKIELELHSRTSLEVASFECVRV